MKKIITATLLFGISFFANALFAQEISGNQLKAIQTDNIEGFKNAFTEADYTKCYQVKGISYNLLSLSVKQEKKNIFNYLVEKVDVNQSCNGITPLMYSATNGYMNAAKLLIKFGAKKDTKDNNGKTAKDYAIKNKQTAMAMVL